VALKARGNAAATTQQNSINDSSLASKVKVVQQIFDRCISPAVTTT